MVHKDELIIFYSIDNDVGEANWWSVLELLMVRETYLKLKLWVLIIKYNLKFEIRHFKIVGVPRGDITVDGSGPTKPSEGGMFEFEFRAINSIKMLA